MNMPICYKGWWKRKRKKAGKTIGKLVNLVKPRQMNMPICCNIGMLPSVVCWIFPESCYLILDTKMAKIKWNKTNFPKENDHQETSLSRNTPMSLCWPMFIFICLKSLPHLLFISLKSLPQLLFICLKSLPCLFQLFIHRQQFSTAVKLRKVLDHLPHLH